MPIVLMTQMLESVNTYFILFIYFLNIFIEV